VPGKICKNTDDLLLNFKIRPVGILDDRFFTKEERTSLKRDKFCLAPEIEPEKEAGKPGEFKFFFPMFC
jgi:hypothetical protein